MQLAALATTVAFILVSLNPPYIDAVYVAGVQIEHGPRDRSEILKQYATNVSSGNEMYPLKNFLIRATIKDSTDTTFQMYK